MNFPSPHAPARGAPSLWARFRGWPWWGQALLWLMWPVPLILLAYSKPADQRRKWWALALAGTILFLAAGISSSTSGGHQKVAAAAPADPTSTTEQHEPSTTTTSTLPAATDALRRSGTGADLIAGARAEPALDRALATDTLLATLASITVEPEHARSGYSRELFPHWDDVDHDGCDTRCEVLSAQRRSDGTWLSEWDGYVTSNTSELQVDHVVALAEAWDSGADRWTAAQRDEFADYTPNLLAVTASENLRKGDRDASEWFPARSEANCLWSSTVVRVKAKWSLSIDQAEHDALANLLSTCSDFVALTTTTAPPPTAAPLPLEPSPTPTPAPEPAPPPAPEPPPSNDCTPGYDPCIPPGSDVDCAGGSGNGPRYVEGPVYVTGSDPYGLDGNHDGVACA